MVIQQSLVPALWLAWLAYWGIAARSAAPTRQRESARSRASYIVPMAIGAYLVAAPRLPGKVLAGGLWPPSEMSWWIGTALVALGLAFSVWARRHLAENWS